MIYELGLISVVVGAGYWGWFFVRQRPHGTATYGVMQLAAAALAGLGLLGHRLDVAWLGIPGAIGLGGGLCLLVIGPRIRALARRMVAAERMALATRLLDLAELLAPGSGVAEEKAVVRAMAEIRDGRIEQTVEALIAARDRAPGDARVAIDERIAMLYLTAHRWQDAIAHAEAHLFGAPPATGGDDEGSLRRALGVAAPVWVDLLGAYGRTGDLDRAADMLARLEDVCAGRAEAAPWLHRGRMMFLALAGRPDAVRALVAPRQARHMSRMARGYWLAVAHERRGDRATAAAIYEQARARSRGRPRALIEQALAGLADARPVELSPAARAVVERVEAAPLPPRIRIARPRARATSLLAALVVVVWAATTLWVGDTADNGVLLRTGALVHGVVASGEWWRLITCVFVHVGELHLGINVLGLVVLGAIAEDLFGRAGGVAIFGAAGIAGAVASYLASRGMVSAGASGAMFGLAGAVFVEITVRRARYRLAWKRGMWGALLVFVIGNLGYGVFTPVIDQWAHGAGLAAGALLGIALSPTARWVRAGAAAGRALAIAFVAAAAVAGVLAVRTSCLDSLTRGGFAPVRVGDVVIRVPAGWRASAVRAPSDGPPLPHDGTVYEVHEPDGLVSVELSNRPGGDPGRQLALWLAEQGRRVKAELRDAEASGTEAGELIDVDVSPLIALPAGWDGRELIVVTPDDGMGNRQRLRLVVCGRAARDGTVLVAIVVPETIAAAAPGFFAQLLASIEA